MLMRLAKACMTAVMLLLAGIPMSAALAKPPVLPNESKDACLEKAPQQEIHSQPIADNQQAIPVNSTGTKPAGTFLFELNVDSGTGIVSAITAGRSEPGADHCSVEALSQASNLLVGFLGGNAGFLGMEVITELTVTEAAKIELIRVMPTPVAQSVCPHVQAQMEKSIAQAPPAAATVLDNLRKLEEVRKLYEQAEQERRAGRFDCACWKYEAVQKLCPGSRFDQQARGRLSELHAKARNATAGFVEEQEDSRNGWWPSGVQMRCKFRLGALNMTVDLKQDGHGSLALGYDTLFGAAIDLLEQTQSLMPLLAPNVSPASKHDD